MSNVYRIAFNGRFLSQTVTGVQRYAIELVKAIDTLIGQGVIEKSKYSFSLLVPKKIRQGLPLKNIPVRQVGVLGGHLWEQFELPVFASDALIVNLCNTGPVMRRHQVVTMHDASVFAFPGEYSFAFRAWYKALLPALGFMSKRIISVSQFSKEELARFCGISEQKMRAIYHGKEHILSAPADYEVISRNHLREYRYILAVGGMSPNKNVASITAAIRLLDRENCRLVVAGHTNRKIFSGCPPSPGKNAAVLGYVTDGQLRALYEKAACLVYPSFYEGFGFPPVEAMACGCPVVVSDIAPLKEICSDAVLYCDPFSPEDVAQKIRQLLTNDKLGQLLRTRAFQRLKELSWENCARETWGVLQETLEG
jgi:glycosyltransferase involved in cell wall biosynthesis